ncbi:MAG TPA: MoxR family ATPase [Gemmatimonadaceae bacterium]|nr:MoxR family ATPase [Gemmatimonadaceae bacterium]
MAAQPIPVTDDNDLEMLARLKRAHADLKEQIGRRIVGHHETVDNLVAAILAGGHVILVGVPGLAKTMLIQTVATCLDLSFQRIQFTPDLMPSDVTGTELLEEDHGTGKRQFKFVQGPVFAQVLLADEINRAPPKTQAALLQSMQEHTVTVSGKTYQLPEPFFVLATQNPIEQEGTYSLPEAQLDRFMFELRMGYPSREEEERIVTTTTGADVVQLRAVLGSDDIRAMQALVRRIPASPVLVQYAVQMARSTRPHEPGASDLVKKYVSYGAGPRASQYLTLAAKARAAMDGRGIPDVDDIKHAALSVLRHRMVLNFQAEAEGVGPEKILGLGSDEVRK